MMFNNNNNDDDDNNNDNNNLDDDDNNNDDDNDVHTVHCPSSFTDIDHTYIGHGSNVGNSEDVYI